MKAISKWLVLMTFATLGVACWAASNGRGADAKLSRAVKTFGETEIRLYRVGRKLRIGLVNRSTGTMLADRYSGSYKLDAVASDRSTLASSNPAKESFSAGPHDAVTLRPGDEVVWDVVRLDEAAVQSAFAFELAIERRPLSRKQRSLTLPEHVEFKKEEFR